MLSKALRLAIFADRLELIDDPFIRYVFKSALMLAALVDAETSLYVPAAFKTNACPVDPKNVKGLGLLLAAAVYV